MSDVFDIINVKHGSAVLQYIPVNTITLITRILRLVTTGILQMQTNRASDLSKTTCLITSSTKICLL
jgi:hypothetical protein